MAGAVVATTGGYVEEPTKTEVKISETLKVAKFQEEMEGHQNW